MASQRQTDLTLEQRYEISVLLQGIYHKKK
jgi:hypothetical protein